MNPPLQFENARCQLATTSTGGAGNDRDRQALPPTRQHCAHQPAAAVEAGDIGLRRLMLLQQGPAPQLLRPPLIAQRSKVLHLDPQPQAQRQRQAWKPASAAAPGYDPTGVLVLHTECKQQAGVEPEAKADAGCGTGAAYPCLHCPILVDLQVDSWRFSCS